MHDSSDEQLMVKFQGGNAATFDLLFQRYRNPLFAFIFRMLGGDRGAAEDLLQEVFLKLLKARDLYDPQQKFSTWLFAITRNHCINALHSKGYRETLDTVSLDDAENPASPLHQRELPAAEFRLSSSERREAGQHLEAAIQALPPAQREVFLLRAVEGFSHQETAQMLRLSPGNVRVIYLRARQVLQRELARQGWEGIRP